tara:strand:+ start:1937 stop:2056 length:120 start_codon:yes stop_codon:yes gene_type:complete
MKDSGMLIKIVSLILIIIFALLAVIGLINGVMFILLAAR